MISAIIEFFKRLFFKQKKPDNVLEFKKQEKQKEIKKTESSIKENKNKVFTDKEIDDMFNK